MFLKNKILIFCLFLFHLLGYSQNLLTNGNFESGGNGVGFNVSNIDYTELTPPFSGSTVQGNYAIVTNPQALNTTNFIASSDHTSGTGKMLVIDGSVSGDTNPFWRAGNTGNTICGLTVGKTYQFSYWIKSICTICTDNTTVAEIDVYVSNAVGIHKIQGNYLASLPSLGWQKVVFAFTATNSCVAIELLNYNLNALGNDFAIDDIELVPYPLSITHTATSSVCDVNGGAIVAYPKDGVFPYLPIKLLDNATSQVIQSNITGIFTNLPSGNYKVEVTDAASNTLQIPDIIISNANVIPIQIAGNTVVCNGQNTTLTATGGTGSFIWTANPSDTTLTTPNASSITVSPSITTTYTATSTVSGSRNLITNGDFSLGNTHFYNDYFFRNVNLGGTQRAFGIVTLARNWFGIFGLCTDHTTGTGNMLTCDSSPLINDIVWQQKVPVSSSANYVFSFFAQSIFSSSPSRLEVFINGISQGILILTNAICVWKPFTVNWNPGSATFADIKIISKNTNTFGNDFAIDDISFTENYNCPRVNSYSVTVNPIITPETNFSYSNSICANATSALPTLPTNFTTGGTFSSTNTSVSVNATTGEINPSICPNNFSITYSVLPGSSCNAAGSSTFNVTLVNSPSAPNISYTDITCSAPTGNITINSPTGSEYEYSINGTNFQSNTLFSNLLANTYSVTVKNINSGCISNAVDQTISSNTSLPNPNFNTTQPNCNLNTGSITVTNLIGTDYVYSINGSAFSSSPTFNNLGANTYTIEVKSLSSGCISSNSETLINATVPSDAEATIIQPTCNVVTGTITITNPLGANLEYSINGGSFQSNNVFANLNPGDYNIQVKYTLSNCLSNLKSFEVINPPISQTPQFSLPTQVCENSTPFDLPITSNNGITGTWNVPSVSTTVAQTYTFTPINSICSTNYEYTFTINSNVLSNYQIITSEPFSSTNSFTIMGLPIDSFYTHIDGVTYFNQNTFPNLDCGILEVNIYSTDGCAKANETVVLFDFPKFFTPNSDGYNDYWNIKCISNVSISEINIFDRYGKLLKQVSTNENGWNGLYNGKEMPSNDYWFEVKYNYKNETKTFKSNFSLKR